MKKKIYKVYHPTIKEISIGDKFVTYGGKIVTFDRYDKKDSHWPFETNLGWYTKKLKLSDIHDDEFDIKSKYISLKDKINLL